MSSLRVAASPNPGAGAYYEGGSQDGSRPGVFYVNLQPLETQKRWEAGKMRILLRCTESLKMP